jgi:small GTP-binding protein
MLVLLLLLFWSKKEEENEEVTEDAPAPPMAKAIFVGDSGVGKTAIITSFIRGEFIDDAQPTVGIAHTTRPVSLSEERLQMELWDVSGCSPDAGSPTYYRGSDVAYIVFDITSQSSFNSLATWIGRVKENSSPVPIMVLIGNKADIAGERVVSYEEAEEFATKNNMEYFETSAKTNADITEAITSCLELLIDKLELTPPSPELSPPSPSPSGGGRL